MRLLDRYILKELLIPLFACLVGGVAFYMTFDLFSCMDELRRNGVGTVGILYYNLVRLPELLVIILPPSLLLALLYAISNHSRYNEIVAMRAAGIGIWRICTPYLVVGVLLGGILFYLNEEWVPFSSRTSKSIRNGASPAQSRTVENVNFVNTQDGSTWSIGRYDPVNKQLYQPCVEWDKPSATTNGKSPGITKLLAETARWKDGHWEFKNVQLFNYAAEGINAQIPIPEKYPTLSLPELETPPEQIESEIVISGFDNFKMARKASLNLYEISLYLDQHPGADTELIDKVKTLYYSHTASPFTCLVVVLVALPFSLQGGRRNVFVGVASSIVICFCFFLLNEVTLALGAGGYVPAWLGAWLPNLLFGVGGFIAVKKMC